MRATIRGLQELLDILNDGKPTPASQTLKEIILANNGLRPGQLVPLWFKHGGKIYREALPVNLELKSITGKLRFIPYPSDMRGFSWLVCDGNQPSIHLTVGIEVLSQLVALRLTHRLRQCRCGSWFFAIRNNHFFHKDSCREKDFRTSRRGRESRARYMRKYRINQEAEGKARLALKQMESGKMTRAEYNAELTRIEKERKARLRRLKSD